MTDIGPMLPPGPARISWGRAMGRWFSRTWYAIRVITVPVREDLGDPNVEIRPTTKPGAGALDAARHLVSRADARIARIEAKATTLTGYLSLVIALMSWILFNGLPRLEAAPAIIRWLAYLSAAIAALSFVGCMHALFRVMGMRAYSQPTIALVVGASGCTKRYEETEEIMDLVNEWTSATTWGNHLADLVRAAQRLLGIALVAAALAAGISYSFPAEAAISMKRSLVAESKTADV